MKIKQYIFFSLLIVLSQTGFSIVIPEKPNPPKLVNDFAGMLTNEEASALENKLVEFDNQSSTQIVVVTVKTLNGEDKAMVATEIGQQWKVGQKGFDNGIVLLVKEKTAESKGDVFIATGYGLEGVIPDATTKLIVENEIIPQFRQGNYYRGIDNAVNTLMKLSLKEFSAKEYEKKAGKKAPFGAIFIVLVFIFIIFNGLSNAKNVRQRSMGRDIPFWVLMGMLGSGSKRSGSFGNFSSGSGGFSSGGGFGGFGGGGFGGGGAGGSW